MSTSSGDQAGQEFLSTGELRLSVPAHHAAARMARARVRGCAEAAGMPVGELDRLEFVVGELLSNAVDHGGGEGAMDAEQWTSGARMHLWMKCGTEGWRLGVEDEGGGGPESLMPFLVETDELPNLEDERGRGFFLLRSYLDTLEVQGAKGGTGVELIATVSFTLGLDSKA